MLQWEGGYVNHPNDPGGATNKGVTFRVYDAWRRSQDLPTQDVRRISDAEVKAIYRRDYWLAARCDRLPPALATAQFDTAVNMGVGRAARLLQRAAGVEQDGKVGDGTLAAVAAGDAGELAIRHCDAREATYRSLAANNPRLQVFLRGWLNRLNALRRALGLPARESAFGDAAPEFTPRLPDELADGAPDGPAPDPEALAAALAAMEEVARLAAAADDRALSEALGAMRARLAALGAPVPEQPALACVLALRAHRRFAAMREACAAVALTGADHPSLRQEYAQALIEGGEILPAVDMLERLLAQGPPAERRAGANALLGRAWKQLFVQGGGAAALRRAVRFYEAGMGENLAPWPAINLVALASRARRDGLDPGSPVDPLALARGLLAQPASDGPWDAATRMEAALAVGNWAQAEALARAYLAQPVTDAFAVAGTLRQLTQVWGLGDAPGAPGADIVRALRADLLRREGGALTLSPGQLQDLAHTPRATLERVLGEPGIVTWEWMRTGLARAAAVGVVRRADGRRVGTGFLLRGSDLDPRLGAEPVFLTNAHVMSPDPNDRPAVERAGAEVLFEAGDARSSHRVGEIVWSSPVERLDACLARLDPTPALAPLPVHEADLPRPPEPGAAPDLESRLYIVGHPLGGPLSFSIQDNVLLDHEGPPAGKPSLDGRVLLHYRTPTEPGSSGSPVFDPVGWRVVALHRAGGMVMRRLNGRGGTYPANEGVWIGSIRAALAARGP